MQEGEIVKEFQVNFRGDECVYCLNGVIVSRAYPYAKLVCIYHISV